MKHNIFPILLLFLPLQLHADDVDPTTKKKVLVVLNGRLVILLWRWWKNNKSQSTSQHKQSLQRAAVWTQTAKIKK